MLEVRMVLHSWQKRTVCSAMVACWAHSLHYYYDGWTPNTGYAQLQAKETGHASITLLATALPAFRGRRCFVGCYRAPALTRARAPLQQATASALVSTASAAHVALLHHLRLVVGTLPRGVAAVVELQRCLLCLWPRDC